MYNNSPFGNNYNEPSMDRLLGKSYLIVKEVHANLDAIRQAVSVTEDNKAVQETIVRLNEILLTLNNKAGNFIGHDLGEVGEEPDANSYIGDNFLSSITKSYTQINTVGENIDSVKLLAIHINELKAIAEALEEILTTSNIIPKIDEVNANISDIKNVSDNATAISAIHGCLSEIRTLAENVIAFPEIIASSDSINKVGKYISSLVTCASNTATYIEANRNLKNAQEVLENKDIGKIAENSEAISKVANKIEDVSTVASNIEDIKKVTNLDGFSDVADLAARVKNLEDNPAQSVDLTDYAKTSEVETLKGTGSIVSGTNDLTSLDNRVKTLEENTSSGVDLSAYAKKTEVTTVKNQVSTITGGVTITKNKTDIKGLDARITSLENADTGSGDSGSSSPVDLSDYAKKTDVNAVIGSTTITAGKNDIAGLTSRVATLESGSSGSGSSSGSGGLPEDFGDWFPLHGPKNNGRCTGIRHEIDKTTSPYTWTAPEACWIVIEGKGGTTTGKDSSMYAVIAHGVETMIGGTGSNNGDNVYLYTSAFMPKGATLKIMMNSLTWVYLAHTAVYRDAGSRPEDDTPAEP